MTWHHSPLHVFVQHTTYMVTAGTLHKEPLFQFGPRLRLLHDTFLELAAHYRWQLQAWAVFTNHYHWIGVAPEDGTMLRKFVSHLHTRTATAINREDHVPGRKVWFQYWDTCLTFENSYLPRLRYVHENAAHHRLVPMAVQYEVCSARWFAANAEPSFQRKVASYGIEKLEVPDEF